jgi:uncharacterized membrane protein (DUF4010 family)
VRLRLSLTIAPAIAVAALDLVVKHVLPTHVIDVHQRSHAWSVLTFVLLVIVVALTVLPSRLAALAAGLVAGGILGNLTSALVRGGRIPNPLVVGNLAFNVGDVFVIAGVPLLMVALVRVAIGHRERIDQLIPPRRWELALRRKLGL